MSRSYIFQGKVTWSARFLTLCLVTRDIGPCGGFYEACGELHAARHERLTTIPCYIEYLSSTNGSCLFAQGSANNAMKLDDNRQECATVLNFSLYVALLGTTIPHYGLG